jgi:hypothetical protein
VGASQLRSRIMRNLELADLIGVDVSGALGAINLDRARVVEIAEGAPRRASDAGYIRIVSAIERALVSCAICKGASVACPPCIGRLKTRRRALIDGKPQPPSEQAPRVSGNDKCEVCFALRCRRHGGNR